MIKQRTALVSAADVILDTSGLLCPYPLLQTKQQLKQMSGGQVIQVISTDPSVVLDFKVFLELSKHKLLSFNQNKDKYLFVIEKA